MSSGLLFGIGNPLLDISVTVDNDYLAKYNLKANDAILAGEEHMGIYEDIVNLEPKYLPGGATQNTITIAQWILKEPGMCVMSGSIKNDTFGKVLKNRCESHGIKTAYHYNHGTEPTGVCACLINGMNRSLVTNLGAAAVIPETFIDDKEIWNLVVNAKFYYIAGFFITSSVQITEKIATFSTENSRTLCFNLSATFLCEFFHEQMMKIIPHVNILFGNESEALAFAKTHKWNTENIGEIAQKLYDLPRHDKSKNHLVVITQGLQPIIVVSTEGLVEYNVSQVPSSEIVDTNGAGDAFVGGFLAQWVKGKGLKEGVRCGIWAAQQIIRQSGSTLPDVCDFE